MEKERNRNLMLYEFKCGHSAAAALRNMCRTVKESTCRPWFAKFLNGEEGFKDQHRSGRKSPSNILAKNLHFFTSVYVHKEMEKSKTENFYCIVDYAYWGHHIKKNAPYCFSSVVVWKRV
jgi:hypothetical protein